MARQAPLHLGETVDPAAHTRSGTVVRIDPASLTTHGVIVGQTGSGKTGLGMALIEEVLLSGVPVILIDPKGDLTNLALQFPSLSAAEFGPWTENGDGAAAAESWTKGLAGWGLGPTDVADLKNSAEVIVWTPGSTTGRPLNLIGSLQAPGGNATAEQRADEVSGTVSGLLALLSIESDPMSGAEHILLSNLVERAWAAGTSLGLDQLVAQIIDPPMRKLGVLELDTFYPPKDRTALAMKLNGLLASPSFAAWGAGEPLDIASMLHNPETKQPRASVVTIAHLSDEERQFAVTKILSALITWMRSQSGSTNLKALVYIDEVFGYVPPTANPPTKAPILTLFKQARAFGLGLVIATQNPVDVDYKVLSNAATWIVGRLQTERDRDRLLDGMRSASGATDIDALSATISSLAKREFILQRAGSDTPTIFTSRWAMTYLRGPLTGSQLAQLPAAKAPAQALPVAVSTTSPGAGGSSSTAGDASVPFSGSRTSSAAPVLKDDETTVPPPVADGISARWVTSSTPWLAEANGTPNATRHVAAAAARLALLFDDDKAGVRESQEWEAIVTPLTVGFDPSAVVSADYDERDFSTTATANAIYVVPGADINKKAFWTDLEKRLVDQAVAARTMTVQRNVDLKIWSRPGETVEAFASRCELAADEQADADTAKLRTTLDTKIDRIQLAIAEAERKAREAEKAHKANRTEEIVAGAGELLGALFGGRRNARSLGRVVKGVSGRRGDSSRSDARADAASDKIDMKSTELAELEQQLADQLFDIDAKWDTVAKNITTQDIPLERADVRVVEIGLVWMPQT
jgi:Helicase HerA, central domain